MCTFYVIENSEVNMKRMIFSILLVTVAVVATSFFARAQSSGFKNISPRAASELLQRDTNVVVLDVRTPEEYRGETGHLPNASLIPVQELESRTDELGKAKDKTILVYCRSGHRSALASDILAKKGFKVINLEGGILQWRKDSLTTVREN
jgi:rhodanese-related sulfurtransferase